MGAALGVKTQWWRSALAGLVAAAAATPSQTALALEVTALPVPRREARPPLAIVVDVSPLVASPPFVLRV